MIPTSSTHQHFSQLEICQCCAGKAGQKKVHGIKCCLPLFLQAYATEACRKEYSHLGLSIVRYSNFPIYFFRTRKRAAYLCIKRERVVLFVCLKSFLSFCKKYVLFKIFNLKLKHIVHELLLLDGSGFFLTRRRPHCWTSYWWLSCTGNILLSSPQKINLCISTNLL